MENGPGIYAMCYMDGQARSTEARGAYHFDMDLIW